MGSTNPSSLYQKLGDQKLDDLLVPFLSATVGIELNLLEEVFKALHDCCGDEAPRLDSMTMAFL